MQTDPRNFSIKMVWKNGNLLFLFDPKCNLNGAKFEHFLRKNPFKLFKDWIACGLVSFIMNDWNQNKVKIKHWNKEIKILIILIYNNFRLEKWQNKNKLLFDRN
jgi:hypothetical protein